MTETWRLQQRLRQMRIAAGRGSADFAATHDIHALARWRLKNSPTAIDAALANVPVFARWAQSAVLDLGAGTSPKIDFENVFASEEHQSKNFGGTGRARADGQGIMSPPGVSAVLTYENAGQRRAFTP